MYQQLQGRKGKSLHCLNKLPKDSENTILLYNLQLDPPTQPGIDSYLASFGMPDLTSVAQQELYVPITTVFSDSFGPSRVCPDTRSTGQYYQVLESNTLPSAQVKVN